MTFCFTDSVFKRSSFFLPFSKIELTNGFVLRYISKKSSNGNCFFPIVSSSRVIELSMTSTKSGIITFNEYLPFNNQI